MIDQITVQVWGGPRDGDVFVLPGRPPFLYLAEADDPTTEPYDGVTEIGYTMWHLPIKLDALAIEYPLKAWWDERSA